MMNEKRLVLTTYRVVGEEPEAVDGLVDELEAVSLSAKQTGQPAFVLLSGSGVRSIYSFLFFFSRIYILMTEERHWRTS
jgi:hypothetical protein